MLNKIPSRIKNFTFLILMPSNTLQGSTTKGFQSNRDVSREAND